MPTVDHGVMLEVLLAHSSTFQALTGAANAAAALAFIRQSQAEDRGADALDYPRAIVEAVEESSEQAGTGTRRRRGALLLSFEAEVPPAHDDTVELQRTWFLDQVRSIQADMEAISDSRATPSGYTHSHLQIKQMTWDVEPFQVPLSEREDVEVAAVANRSPVWACRWRVEW